jgi:hypothetical protein
VRREKQIGGSGGSLEPPGPLLTHLHTIYIAYSGCLPTRLNPLAERTCFSQVSASIFRTGEVLTTVAGVYELLYTVADSAGNTATKTRTVEVVGSGCTDSAMFNYDPGAALSVATICAEYLYGCGDASSVNFDVLATTDQCRYGDFCTGIPVRTTQSGIYPDVVLIYQFESEWCTCAAGYTGTHCELNIDECASNPCGQFQCTDSVNDYRCDCSGGSNRGKNCDQQLCTAGENDCTAVSTCLKLIAGGHECACDFGSSYTAGAGCSVTDECSSSPCENGGTCLDATGFYSCICQQGFSGTNCAIADSDCQRGTCVPLKTGCMDGSQFNYDAGANAAGECQAYAYGCIDRSMFNWNASANTDDGSCIPYRFGCTDDASFNFDPEVPSI